MKNQPHLRDPSLVSPGVRALNPHLYGGPVATVSTISPTAEIPASEQRRPSGPKRATEPNQTEREFEIMLRARFPRAIIRWEAYVLRLADRATYSPDYSVQHEDGTLEFFEVKGSYVFPKALVKPRIAAATFHHKITLAQKLKDGWQETVFAGPKPTI